MKVMLKTAGPRTDIPPGTPSTPTPQAPAASTPPAAQAPPVASVPPPAVQQAPPAAPVAQVPPAASAPVPVAASVPPPAAVVPPPAAVAQAPVASIPPPASAVVPPPAPNPAPVLQQGPPVAAPAPAVAPEAVSAPITVLTPSIVTPEDEAEERAARQLAAPSSKSIFGGQGGMEGEWDKNNLILPRLQIVQGNGELAKRFPGGSTIIADEIFLSSPNAQSPPVPVNFVPIILESRFREVVDAASGLRPRIVMTSDEVKALGGTLEWGPGNTKPTWNQTAKAVLLVQQPEGINHPAFSEVENLPGRFAVLLYYASGVSMKHFANVIATAAASTLRVPTATPGQSVPYLPKRWWRFTIEPRPWGKTFNPFAVVAKQTTYDTDDVVRAYCNSYSSKKIQDDES